MLIENNSMKMYVMNYENELYRKPRYEMVSIYKSIWVSLYLSLGHTEALYT